MKALAIDSAVPSITITACNQQKKASLTLDLGMRQSETIIPSIEYVVKQVDLLPKDIDFIALSGGPGSFTGLRLGFAAAKALQLTLSCPVYAIPTLEAQALPYSAWPGTIISTIDAKKERFYVQFFSDGKNLSPPMDLEIDEIIGQIKEKSNILLVGPDRHPLYERLKSTKSDLDIKFFPQIDSSIGDALLYLGNQAFEKNTPSLESYQGPVYLRKSEAEENLNHLISK